MFSYNNLVICLLHTYALENATLFLLLPFLYHRNYFHINKWETINHSNWNNKSLDINTNNFFLSKNSYIPSPLGRVLFNRFLQSLDLYFGRSQYLLHLSPFKGKGCSRKFPNNWRRYDDCKIAGTDYVQ